MTDSLDDRVVEHLTHGNPMLLERLFASTFQDHRSLSVPFYLLDVPPVFGELAQLDALEGARGHLSGDYLDAGFVHVLENPSLSARALFLTSYSERRFDDLYRMKRFDPISLFVKMYSKNLLEDMNEELLHLLESMLLNSIRLDGVINDESVKSSNNRGLSRLAYASINLAMGDHPLQAPLPITPDLEGLPRYVAVFDGQSVVRIYRAESGQFNKAADLTIDAIQIPGGIYRPIPPYLKAETSAFSGVKIHSRNPTGYSRLYLMSTTSDLSSVEIRYMGESSGDMSCPLDIDNTRLHYAIVVDRNYVPSARPIGKQLNFSFAPESVS